MLKSILAFASVVLVSGSVFAADVTVEQADTTFSKSAVTIKAGDTINFANKDTVTHNVTVLNPDGDPSDLGLQKPGETTKNKFDKAGDYQVRCAIHPRMKVAVTVE